VNGLLARIAEDVRGGDTQPDVGRGNSSAEE
jgi:hypothetical protein